MNMKAALVGLGLIGLVVVGGCKGKEEEPQIIPMPTSSAAGSVKADPGPSGSAAPAAGDTASATGSAAPATTQSAAPTPPTTPVTPTGPRGESIDGCCSALAAYKSSGRPADVKAKAATAATICSGIAKRVKDGQVSRSSAMTTIKAQIAGLSVPECN